jgi:hypothetical protein
MYREKEDYGVEQFVTEMRTRGYDGEVMDIPKDQMKFLSSKKKNLMVGSEFITIYIYRNNFLLEKDADKQQPDGSGLKQGIEIEWASYPHFYKKGKIIVQYIGNNEKIISDLKNVMEYQFAGL